VGKLGREIIGLVVFEDEADIVEGKRDKKKQTMTSRKISTGAKREALAYIGSDTMIKFIEP
jgi:hypothetical protein